MTGGYATASAEVAEAEEAQQQIQAPATQLRLEIGAKVIPHPEKVRNRRTQGLNLSVEFLNGT